MSPINGDMKTGALLTRACQISAFTTLDTPPGYPPVASHPLAFIYAARCPGSMLRRCQNPATAVSSAASSACVW